MRYLVRARVKPGCEQRLLKAIEDGTLGRGSVAGDEYLRNMHEARLCEDESARWVEVCYCPTPLQEEREDWRQYFELTEYKTRMTAVVAEIKTDPSPGLAAIAIAQNVWRENCRRPASHFSNHFAAH